MLFFFNIDLVELTFKPKAEVHELFYLEISSISFRPIRPQKRFFIDRGIFLLRQILSFVNQDCVVNPKAGIFSFDFIL